MILKNLKSRMKVWFQSEKDYQEDKVLLEGLLVQDKEEEAQAYAYILASIASADTNFDATERQLVSAIMYELFPSRKVDIAALISNAESMLASFRTSDRFIAKIKEEYSQEERERLYSAIDKVIQSDSTLDTRESFLREKFQKALL